VVSLAEVGLDASILDRSARACDDLYQLACGRWLATTKIPEDSWGVERSFGAMRQAVEDGSKAMLDRAAADPGSDETRRMLGDFWASCLDEAAIDAAGAEPIRPFLDRIERARRPVDLVRALADLEGLGVYALVHADVGVDELDSSRMTATLRKSGWTLPRKDYVDSDARSVDARARYAEGLRALFRAAGFAEATIDRRVRHAITVETLLSISDDPRGDNRPKPTPLAVAELEREAPGVPWKDYLGAVGLGSEARFNVADVSGLRRASEVILGQSIEALRDYGLARVLHDLAYALGAPFTDAKHAIASIRSGAKQKKPRLQACLKITEHTIPRAMVREYARAIGFDREDAATRQMVDDVYAAFRSRLRDAAWLDGATRAAALEKLRRMPYHLGYAQDPGVERLRIDRRTFAANVFLADRDERRRHLDKLRRPPDAAEWTRSPLEVNAYHDHERNSVFIHMAMLQPPIYDPRASIAVRYGAMGMVIGHELAHGFDHHGAKFDASGTRADWWSDATRAEFEKRKTCFEEQFSTYEILPGLKVDGKLSVGENIADVAGLRVAFEAYRARRAEAPERIVAEGFSEDQQFFLSRAQAWCVVMTEQAARDSAKTNPHIAPRWAVNGPVHHLAEFHQAFGCEPPKDVCAMW
jgi:putative endopeptidase